MSDRAFTALRRKLEAWELEHLRALIATQADRIERLEDEVDILKQNAEFWRNRAEDLVHEITDPDFNYGITPEGQIGIVDSDDNPLIERRGQPIESGNIRAI